MTATAIILCYIGAYGLVTAGGWVLVGTCIALMRLAVRDELKPSEYAWKNSYKVIDFLVGSTERAVALTLVLLVPQYLPAFVGGWIALKFAAHWQRQRGEEASVPSHLFLISSVISFGTAIAIGLIINPTAIDVWRR